MLKGINASKGYGIGRVLVVREQNLSFTPRTDCDAGAELTRYRAAVNGFCQKTEEAAREVKRRVGEKEAEILSGHILMLQDPYMNSEIEKRIAGGECAESALSAVCDTFIMVFSSTEDELTRQRAADVRDIRDGILTLLLDAEETDIAAAPAGTVLVARDLTPSMTANIRRENIVGIVTEMGGTTSHSAILARAMEIPAVVSVPGAVAALLNGSNIIVDGSRGLVLEAPTAIQVDEYTRLRADYIAAQKALARFVGKPTETADGLRVELFANISAPEEANRVIECDGEGVGLFRTEFLYMDRTVAPSEQEQFEAYKKAVLILRGRPVIIRTLDVGGDKGIPYLGTGKEENPFLGFRAVRYCLKNRELFRSQLRALVRASAFGDLRIMLPLVTCVEEVREVKVMLKSIMLELESESIAYNKGLKLGVMIETPAAALMADLLAKEVDFFSIGTNDLTQYTMAVDRGNAEVAYLYSAFQPSVLRSIRHIIECAKAAGIPVGMCGESASHPALIPLLLSFGLNEFSVSPAAVLATRKAIAEWDLPRAKQLAAAALTCATEPEVTALLQAREGENA